jgi:hypothetical protein
MVPSFFTNANRFAAALARTLEKRRHNAQGTTESRCTMIVQGIHGRLPAIMITFLPDRRWHT